MPGVKYLIMNKKILITEPFDQDAVNLLKEVGLDVTLKINPSEEELVGMIAGFDALIVRSRTKVTGAVIKAGKNLKVIGRAGVGVDNIDVPAATRQGIIVMNAPDANTISTAELTMSLILALSRNIYQAIASLRAGKWEKSRLSGTELYGKTLGIIGLGRIGSAVAVRAGSFGMSIVAYDPFVSVDKARKLSVKLVSLDELLAQSDYITMHLSLTKETKYLLGKDAFAKMKTGVRIVNCSRGGVIDESALYNAIKEKKVAGCALDVFEKEPPVDNPLLSLDEVIATPHLGASTQEAQTKVSLQIAQQVKKALMENIVENAVNFPSIDPSILKEIQPYITLAEKLGSFQAQMVDGNIERLHITLGGEISDYQTQPFTLSLLKGLLEPTVTGAVNYVNSRYIAEERGIKIVETKSRDVQDFANLIHLEVETTKEKSSVAGTLFSKKEPRIVRINGYHVDASPEGYLLLCENYDKPGAVAHISAVLMEAGINIANMTVGRKEVGGRAVILLNIDSSVSDEVLEKIKNNPIIIQVRLLEL